MSIYSRGGEETGGIAQQNVTEGRERMNYRYMQQHGGFSQCWAKATRAQEVHTPWFHLLKVQKQAK